MKKFRGGTTTLRMRGFRLVAALAVAAVLSGTAMAAGPVTPAFAKDWPSWDDVREARSDEKAAKSEIRRIRGMLVELRAGVEAAAAEAEKANEAYITADDAFQQAHMKAAKLAKQAKVATAKAEESRLQAGRLIAQSSRIGGGDIGATLFSDAENATELLQMLSRAGQLSLQTDAIYALAVQEKNTAQALTDEAKVAREVRDEARKAAQVAYEAAQAAAQAAQSALEEEQAHAAEMEAQLAALTDRRKDLDTEYVKYKKHLAAQAAAAAAAQANAGSGGGGGGGGQVSTGAVVNGWMWPSQGWISANFGYRPPPTPTSPAFHYGTDIAAGYCGAPIYAAASGTVEFIGYSPSGYGNYIRINHGGGVTTQYGHIMNGGVKVGWGQGVSVGQLIAYSGTTGNSTGCHVHFEVRINGAVTDPIAFVRGKGAPVA
jgi:murein DD-endopeptidase MepM/ murein hydrolase activator NlpD